MKIDKHYLYTFGSVLLWSTSPLTMLMFLDKQHWAGLQYLAFAFLFASIFLFLVAWKQGKLKEIMTYKIRDFFIIFALGILGIFLYNMLNTYAYMFASGTEATAANYFWPMWVIIFSMIIMREKITLLKILATLLSLFGMVLIVTKGDLSSLVNSNILGIGLAFLGAILYGLFSALTKKVRYDKTVATMFYFLFSTILAFICLFAFSSLPNWTLQTSLWLILRGVGQFGIAYTLWTMAIMGDTVRISNIALITPFLQLAALALFLGETVGLVSIFGLVCIIVGTLIARVPNK